MFGALVSFSDLQQQKMYVRFCQNKLPVQCVCVCSSLQHVMQCNGVARLTTEVYDIEELHILGFDDILIIVYSINLSTFKSFFK